MSDFNLREDKLPTISIVIPTYNEEKNIDECLASIFSQYYPLQLLEVLVVDNYSKDNTVNIAKKYKIKLIYNDVRDPEVSKIKGFRHSGGELFMYLDADIQLRGNNWFRQMVYPLIEEEEVAGAFTRYVSRRTDPALNRFISYHPLQCDPIYEYFSTSIKNTIVQKKNGYEICKYKIGAIPPAAMCLYKKKILENNLADTTTFLDLDNLVTMVKSGFDKFAYVPKAGVYHRHAGSITDLSRKRIRNVEKVYLPNIEKRKFTWFNLKTFKGMVKILIWIIYVHLFVPELIRGVIKTIRHRDAACLYEPVVSIYITDSIIYTFLKNKKGRHMLLQSIKILKSKMIY